MKFPSAVLTVIEAVPILTPVTKPSALTVALAELDVQDTALFAAFDGIIVATSCVVNEAWDMKLVGYTVTPLTGIGVPGTDTVITAVAVRFESSVVLAVIVVVPAIAVVVITPFETVATAVLLDDQFSVVFVVLLGRIVANKDPVEFVNNANVEGDRAKEVAWMDKRYGAKPNPFMEPNPVQLS